MLDSDRLVTHKANDAVELKLSFDAPLEVHDAAQHHIEEAERKLKTKAVALESLGKARGFVDFVIGLGDIVSDIYPAAANAVKIITFVFDKLKEQEECHALAEDLLDTLATFLPFTAAVDPEAMKLTNTKQIVGNMLELYGKAGELIIQFSSQDILGDTLESKQGEIEGVKDEFKKARKAFDWCIKLEIWKTTLNTEGLGEEQLLRQLNPAEKAFYDPNDACLSGTRESLLSTIRDNLADSSDAAPQLVYLCGPDGSGKTAVVNSVALEFDTHNYLSGCFCFRENHPDFLEPDLLLPTLAYQLCRWHEPYRKKVVQVLQGSDRAKLDSKILQWQYDLLFERPFKELHAGDESDIPPKPLLVIVDGLDVCEEGSVPLSRISAHLARIATLVPWLRVFLSGQSIPEIEDGLSEVACRWHKVDINSYPAEEDIEKFNKDWITKLPRLDAVWYTEERIKEISDKAGGRFLWASTAAKYVTDHKKRNKNRAMDKVLAMQPFDPSVDNSRKESDESEDER